MSKSDTKEILERVETLSNDEKVYIADQILQSMHEIDPEIDKEWVKIAEERLSQIREGNVSMISEEDLFEEIERK
jgi:predicted O-methyltransferase YrrM